MCPILNRCGDTAVWKLRINNIQGVSGGIVSILGGGSMDYSE
jgi:hypothetical protein